MKKMYLISGITILVLLVLVIAITAITATSVENPKALCHKDCSSKKATSESLCKTDYKNQTLQCKNNFRLCMNSSKEILPGSDRDKHGCIPSAGYKWCQEKKECLRPSESNCSKWDKDSKIVINRTLVNQNIKQCSKEFNNCTKKADLERKDCWNNMADLHRDCEHTCSLINKTCPTNYKPVCGENNKTYGNECESKAADIKKECDGVCPCNTTTDTLRNICETPKCDNKNGKCNTMCPMIYKPVCGWYNPDKIQCFRYPCATEFANSCLACKNTDVSEWTPGKCPGNLNASQ